MKIENFENNSPNNLINQKKNSIFKFDSFKKLRFFHLKLLLINN